MSRRPGGELASRPLHFFWLCDCSGSMQADGKIQSLNNAIREAIPHTQKAAADNPNAQVFVRVVRFSDGAQWHVPQPTPIDEFRWMDMSAGGMTDLGKALDLVSDQLEMPPMTDRALPPILVLVSDGRPTDDFGAALRRLLQLPWGQRSVRLAIAIGQDADHGPLQAFIANPEIAVLQANNSETLVNYIRWASTAVLKAASAPSSQFRGGATSLVPVPTPPTPGSAQDVW